MSNFEVFDFGFIDLNTVYELEVLVGILVPPSCSFMEAVAIMNSIERRSEAGLFQYLQRRFGGSSSSCGQLARSIIDHVIGEGLEYEIFKALRCERDRWSRKQIARFDELFAHFH